MSRPFQIRHDNWVKGMQRDVPASPDGIRSMRTIKNYRYNYEGDKVKLKMRKGYTRWNDTALDDVATQLFWFYDLDGNEHLLGIVDSKWFKISESGAHVELSDETVTAPRPVVQVGNRVFFATDTAWRWTDDTAIGGATKSYRLGILKPEQAPSVVASSVDGNYSAPQNPLPGAGMFINATTIRKLAGTFTATADEEIQQAKLYLQWTDLPARSGSVKVSLYTVTGGKPDALVEDTAFSRWIPVAGQLPFVAPGGDYYERTFTFNQPVSLTNGTTYCLVFEGDDAYYDNYHISNFFVTLAYNAVAGGLVYNDNTDQWSAIGSQLCYWLGGLTDDTYYDYVITYLNDTYGIESRPSENQRIEGDDEEKYTISATASSDSQVTHFRVYRREVGSDPTVLDSAITDTYKKVGEVAVGSSYVDAATTAIGAELQTSDHYAADEVDDSGEELRTAALIPKYACSWKGRIIFSIAGSNTFYFTKRLEKDGATGQTGRSIYDYVPLENFQEMPVPSDIIGLLPMGNDQLVVYFKDESIWVVRGMNEVLNPPSDIGRVPMLGTNGLTAVGSLSEILGRQVYMSSEGVQIFNGSPNLEHVSLHIQSIFDSIQAVYLDDSIISIFGDEIWVLVDDDNDGNLESIYIVDIKKPELAWRLYDYGVNLNALVLRRTGSTFRTVFAADVDNAYVLELESGTTDNDEAIDAMVEFHKLDVPDRAVISDVEIEGYYPGVPSGFDVTIIDHIEDETLYSIQPSSSIDKRGNHTGCRVVSYGRIRARIETSAVEEDELLAVTISGEAL